MSVVVYFDSHEDHVRGVGILTEAEEKYHGVDKGAILVSNAAFRMLRNLGIRFSVVGEEERKEEKAE